MAERGILIVIVTHDLQLAARYCDRIIVMRDGRIVSMGTAQEVITEGMIRDVFGMRARVSYDEEIQGMSVFLVGRDSGGPDSGGARGRRPAGFRPPEHYQRVGEHHQASDDLADGQQDP